MEQTNEACPGKELRYPSSFSFRRNLSVIPHGYEQPLKIYSCSVINILTTEEDCTTGQLQKHLLRLCLWSLKDTGKKAASGYAP